MHVVMFMLVVAWLVNVQPCVGVVDISASIDGEGTPWYIGVVDISG